MLPKFKNAEELHTYIATNPLHKNQVLATISIELKKQYKNHQAKIRQQRFREANKDIANERSRVKMASNRSQNPEKYRQMNSEHNKTYRNKNKSNIQKSFDQIVEDISVGLQKQHAISQNVK